MKKLILLLLACSMFTPAFAAQKDTRCFELRTYYAALGKLSLAQVYLSAGRNADAEKLLRSLYEKPSVSVSKEQAAIALARAIAVSKPAEARKLLEPLRSQRPAISQTAITLLGGVEPILQASPNSNASTILSPWSLGSSAGGEAAAP